MENDIIPFTMEIKAYHEDGTYEVEYKPNDPQYQNIQLAIGISLTDTEASTEEQILSRLATNSPQYFWKQQALSKTFDSTFRKSFVGQVHEDAHNFIQTPDTLAAPSHVEYLPISETVENKYATPITVV